MDPNTYRTIMTGHALAKLYGALMEAELSDYMETVENRTQLPLVLGFTLAHGHTRLVM